MSEAEQKRIVIHVEKIVDVNLFGSFFASVRQNNFGESYSFFITVLSLHDIIHFLIIAGRDN